MEDLYDTPIDSKGNALGERCLELADRDFEYFSLSSIDMDLLRREVLYGATTYQDMLADINTLTKRYNKTRDLEALITLIDLHI